MYASLIVSTDLWPQRCLLFLICLQWSCLKAVSVLTSVSNRRPAGLHRDGRSCFEDRKLAPIIKRLENSVEDSLHDRVFWNSKNKRLYLTITTPHRFCIPGRIPLDWRGCRKVMTVSPPAIPEGIAPTRNSHGISIGISIGQTWERTSKNLLSHAISVKGAREDADGRACCSLFQCQVILGKISAWTWLYMLVYHQRKVVRTQFLRLWIISPKWFLLYQRLPL